VKHLRIEGKHRCNSGYKDCDHEYEWIAQIGQDERLSIYQVDTLDKPVGSIIETTNDKYVVSIWCPGCKQDNLIIYKRT
jgi:hypothetical protein